MRQGFRFFSQTHATQKTIGRATSTKPNDVLDRFWPLMTAEKIIKCSTYRDDNNDKIELIDILEGIVSLVD
ncbi:DNA helicase [Yersinia pestis]|nr:DNA helicase [Yersinia pestis]KZC55137.1 DNA helicase [Yersinia pestis]PCN63341.1 DNA helicase [Yersinia pestis]PVT94375.1 DNA helicase [Yersinia pestis]PVU17657.1 DNA helicase [Yersinia pestis]